MAPQHLILLLIVNLGWGFNFVAAKTGLAQLPPMVFTGLRFFLVVILLFPFARWPAGQGWRVFWVAQMSGGIGFALSFFALSIAGDIATVALPLQLGAPLAVILSVILLGEKVGWRRTLGVSTAFAGIVIMSFDPRVLQHLTAVVIAIGSATSFAIATLLLRHLKGIGVFQLQFWIAAGSLPTIMALSALFETGQISAMQQANTMAYGAVVLTTIAGSIIGHGGLYYLLQRYPVSRVLPVTVLAPLFGVVFGILLLGDALTWRMAIGGAVTLTGVVIVQVRTAGGSSSAQA